MNTLGSVQLGFTAGDVAVVTGAASGIGRATAVRAAQQGLSVAAWDINQSGLDATIEQIGDLVPTVGILADTSDRVDVERALAASAELGTLRHLANVAGPPATADLTFDDAILKSLGSMRLMVDRWLAPGAPDRATLVNVASVAGNVVGTNSDWYCAAKAGIVGWTRHLAAYRTAEVRANAVGPGMVDTPRLAGFAASDVGQRVLQRIPVHRMADADEIAWVILFLLSPLASYINGAFVPVDGGWTVTQ